MYVRMMCVCMLYPVLSYQATHCLLIASHPTYLPTIPSSTLPKVTLCCKLRSYQPLVPTDTFWEIRQENYVAKYLEILKSFYRPDYNLGSTPE